MNLKKVISINKKSWSVAGLAGLLVFFSSASPGKGEATPKEKNEYIVAAYIWPSCHHDERFGDML